MTTARTIALALLFGSFALRAEPLRVGTFNTRAVALAFYNSELWAGVMKAKHAERDAAKRAADSARIAELEKWGKAQQELAHSQVFGTEPIPNVIEHLAPAFPSVAKAASVDVIASEVHYLGDSARKVDVTMHIADWLKSSEKTRAMMKSFLEGKVPPSPGPHKH